MSALLLRASPFHLRQLRGALSLGMSVHRPRGEARQHSSLSSVDESEQKLNPSVWPSDRRAALPCDVKVPDYNISWLVLNPSDHNSTQQVISDEKLHSPCLYAASSDKLGLQRSSLPVSFIARQHVL